MSSARSSNARDVSTRSSLPVRRSPRSSISRATRSTSKPTSELQRRLFSTEHAGNDVPLPIRGALTAASTPRSSQAGRTGEGTGNSDSMYSRATHSMHSSSAATSVASRARLPSLQPVGEDAVHFTEVQRIHEYPTLINLTPTLSPRTPTLGRSGNGAFDRPDDTSEPPESLASGATPKAVLHKRRQATNRKPGSAKDEPAVAAPATQNTSDGGNGDDASPTSQQCASAPLSPTAPRTKFQRNAPSGGRRHTRSGHEVLRSDGATVETVPSKSTTVDWSSGEAPPPTPSPPAGGANGPPAVPTGRNAKADPSVPKRSKADHKQHNSMPLAMISSLQLMARSQSGALTDLGIVDSDNDFLEKSNANSIRSGSSSTINPSYRRRHSRHANAPFDPTSVAANLPSSQSSQASHQRRLSSPQNTHPTETSAITSAANITDSQSNTLPSTNRRDRPPLPDSTGTSSSRSTQRRSVTTEWHKVTTSGGKNGGMPSDARRSSSSNNASRRSSVDGHGSTGSPDASQRSNRNRRSRGNPLDLANGPKEQPSAGEKEEVPVNGVELPPASPDASTTGTTDRRRSKQDVPSEAAEGTTRRAKESPPESAKAKRTPVPALPKAIPAAPAPRHSPSSSSASSTPAPAAAPSAVAPQRLGSPSITTRSTSSGDANGQTSTYRTPAPPSASSGQRRQTLDLAVGPSAKVVATPEQSTPSVSSAGQDHKLEGLAKPNSAKVQAVADPPAPKERPRRRESNGRRSNSSAVPPAAAQPPILTPPKPVTSVPPITSTPTAQGSMWENLPPASTALPTNYGTPSPNESPERMRAPALRSPTRLPFITVDTSVPPEKTPQISPATRSSATPATAERTRVTFALEMGFTESQPHGVTPDPTADSTTDSIISDRGGEGGRPPLLSIEVASGTSHSRFGGDGSKVGRRDRKLPHTDGSSRDGDEQSAGSDIVDDENPPPERPSTAKNILKKIGSIRFFKGKRPSSAFKASQGDTSSADGEKGMTRGDTGHVVSVSNSEERAPVPLEAHEKQAVLGHKVQSTPLLARSELAIMMKKPGGEMSRTAIIPSAKDSASAPKSASPASTLSTAPAVPTQSNESGATAPGPKQAQPPSDGGEASPEKEEESLSSYTSYEYTEYDSTEDDSSEADEYEGDGANRSATAAPMEIRGFWATVSRRATAPEPLARVPARPLPLGGFGRKAMPESPKAKLTQLRSVLNDKMSLGESENSMFGKWEDDEISYSGVDYWAQDEEDDSTEDGSHSFCDGDSLGAVQRAKSSDKAHKGRSELAQLNGDASGANKNPPSPSGTSEKPKKFLKLLNRSTVPVAERRFRPLDLDVLSPGPSKTKRKRVRRRRTSMSGTTLSQSGAPSPTASKDGRLLSRNYRPDGRTHGLASLRQSGLQDTSDLVSVSLISSSLPGGDASHRQRHGGDRDWDDPLSSDWSPRSQRKGCSSNNLLPNSRSGRSIAAPPSTASLMGVLNESRQRRRKPPSRTSSRNVLAGKNGVTTTASANSLLRLSGDNQSSGTMSGMGAKRRSYVGSSSSRKMMKSESLRPVVGFAAMDKVPSGGPFKLEVRMENGVERNVYVFEASVFGSEMESARSFVTDDGDDD